MANDDWRTVDIDTDLSEANRKLYAAAKEAYKAYKAARDAFEQAMQDDFAEHLPAGQELKFGYNFGKLSLAIGPAKQAKAKAQSKGNLADWLNAQSNSGRAS